MLFKGGPFALKKTGRRVIWNSLPHMGLQKTRALPLHLPKSNFGKKGEVAGVSSMCFVVKELPYANIIHIYIKSSTILYPDIAST